MLIAHDSNGLRFSYLLHYFSARCVTFKELFVCKSNNKVGDFDTTSVDENTIGVLYESSQSQTVFQQIKFCEIIGSEI